MGDPFFTRRRYCFEDKRTSAHEVLNQVGALSILVDRGTPGR